MDTQPNQTCSAGCTFQFLPGSRQRRSGVLCWLSNFGSSGPESIYEFDLRASHARSLLPAATPSSFVEWQIIEKYSSKYKQQHASGLLVALWSVPYRRAAFISGLFQLHTVLRHGSYSSRTPRYVSFKSSNCRYHTLICLHVE